MKWFGRKKKKETWRFSVRKDAVAVVGIFFPVDEESLYRTKKLGAEAPLIDMLKATTTFNGESNHGKGIIIELPTGSSEARTLEISALVTKGAAKNVL